LRRLAGETRNDAARSRFLVAATCMVPQIDCEGGQCTRATARSRVLYYFLDSAARG